MCIPVALPDSQFVCLNHTSKSDIKDEDIDFTFIGYVSKAIVFHFNEENSQNETGSQVVLEPLEFLNYQGEEYKKEKGIEYIENILFQYTSEENEAFTQFTVATDRTGLLLNRVGFEWVKLAEGHVSIMIGFCKEVGYL